MTFFFPAAKLCGSRSQGAEAGILSHCHISLPSFRGLPHICAVLGFRYLETQCPREECFWEHCHGFVELQAKAAF